MEEMYDLITLGSGVTGMSAGVYAARGGINAIVLEKSAPGGQLLLTESIENYPGIEYVGGVELAQKMKAHAEKFGLKIKTGEVTDIEMFDDHVEVKTKKETYKTRYLLIGIGARPRELGVPGENEYRGKGVSYCATCDGAFFKGLPCIIVGGGDSAFDEAIALTKHASKVTIIHRRDEFRAEKYLVDLADKNEKIEFLMNSEIKEILGDDKVNAVKIFNNKDNKEYEMPIDGVFVFIGYVPNSDFLKGKIDIDDHGEILVDINMKTSHDRVYAAGDIRTGSVKQVISSGGDGVTAVLNIMHKLRAEGQM